MKFCSECGTKFQNENVRFCPNCGKPTDNKSLGDTVQDNQISSSAVDIKTAVDKNMRKIFLLEMISNALLFVIAIIVSFSPIAKIGTSSLGNSWNVFSDFFNAFPEDSIEIPNYILQNSILILPALLIIGMLFTEVFLLILNFAVRKSERYYYNVITNKRIGVIIISFLLIIVAVVIVVSVRALYSIYSLNIGFLWLLCVLFIARKIIVDICAYKLVNNAPDKIEKYKKVKKIENKFMLPRMLTSVGTCAISLSVLLMALVSIIYYTGYPRYSEYMIMKDATQLEYLDSEFVKQNHDFYEDKDLINEIINSNRMYSRTEVAYSFNYHFYSDFIEKTEDKIMKLMPDSDSENPWEDYLVKLKELEDDMKIAKELQIEKYMYAESKIYTSGEGGVLCVMTFLDTNAGSSGEKWGEDGEWYRFGASESITLSETEFPESTDFEKTNILAYVTYSDGSKRFSIIKPTNIEELKEVSAGKHTVKWADEWGTYEAEIIIK